MAHAVVLGEINLVWALGRAGIRSVVVEDEAHSARFSRFAAGSITRPDLPSRSEQLLNALIDHARRHEGRPVLYYATPETLLFVSRNREVLSEFYRFVIGDPKLIETLLDKHEFAALGDRLGLPVPRTYPNPKEIGDDVRYPLVVKPALRGSTLQWLEGHSTQKAAVVENPDHLADVAAMCDAAGVPVILQEAIAGPESRIESYHMYRTDDGEVRAEFTGRKIRTWPPSLGHSTALEISDAGDVRDLGRAIAQRLELTGVAKFDFKRDDDGQLHLLEVNPRFTLWNNLAAAAGLNIPGIVWSDLTGAPTEHPVGQAAPGAIWCHPLDYLSARSSGMPANRWLRFFLKADVRSSISVRDPVFTGVYLMRGLANVRSFVSSDGPDER